MFDGLTDDDDSFFTPASSSHLASLFGLSVANTPSNSSLTYTAPKQPNNKSEGLLKNSPKNKHQSSVIVFKEVYAFKTHDKKYINQGKCGLALIGNDDLHLYQLLLYKQKNDIISYTRISDNFQFTFQKDNYASYYDDQKQNWTVRFNSKLELNQFSSTLESRGGKLLKINESEINDSSNIKTESTKSNTVIEEKQIDSNSQSEILSSNAKANILFRMAKVGQRLLPSVSLSDGTDSDSEKDKSLSDRSRKIEREITTATSTLNANSLPNTAKTSDLTSRTSQDLSNLQAITQKYEIGQNISLIPSQINTKHGDSNSAYPSDLPTQDVSPVFYTSLIQPSYDQMFQMFFSENRTHNSEVRMNILRLTNKMEEVLQNVQKIDTNCDKITSFNEIRDKSLKEDNERLKSLVEELENFIQANLEDESCNGKFVETEQRLLNENHKLKKELEKYIENEHYYKERIKELESKVKKCEDIGIVKAEACGDQLSETKYEKMIESVKKIMNSLYSEVINQIQHDGTLQGQEIEIILAQKIRENTYNIISSVNDLK